MMKQAKVAIERPEDAKEFRELKKQQDAAHAEIERCGVEIHAGRGRLDELMAGQAAGVTDPSLREEQRKLSAKVNAAREAKVAAQAKLRELAQRLPLVRQEAAAAIAAKVAPEFNRQAANFLKARLVRLGPEIAAASAVLHLRDEIEARRVGLRGMYLPETAKHCEFEHRQLRQDTLAALDAGVLKKSDVPSEVKEAWAIK